MLGNSLCISKNCYFQIHFVHFYRTRKERSILSFYANTTSKEVSLFLQTHMNNTLFGETTASPITTTRRVFYTFVYIILHYLEKLKSCYVSWTHFVSSINTWTVYIPCSITHLEGNLLQRVEICLTTSIVQSLLIKETEESTKCRVLQKRRLLRKKLRQHFMSAF